jgi:hypothetical protein
MRTGSASFSSTPSGGSRTAQARPRAGAGIAPVLCRTEFLCAGLIHQSAWKWNSAKLNFRFHDFCDLRHILRSSVVRSSLVLCLR